ncbi:MAG: cyclase family protein [Armatimonadetes bacterium]|nr:cyclase family protein [Armatimonadota bacterium]
MKINKIYDITLPITSKTIVWPGDPQIKIIPSIIKKESETIQISKLILGSHSGTHLDAPKHFIPNSSGVDKLDLSILIGKVRVFNLPVKEKIAKNDLEKLDFGLFKRVIFKTRNSKLLNKNKFYKNYVYLDEEAVKYLIKKKIKLVGIDYHSIEKYKKERHPSHHLLLKEKIIILEALNLKEIPAGVYTLICLPLKIKDADGSPVRAVLIK